MAGPISIKDSDSRLELGLVKVMNSATFPVSSTSHLKKQLLEFNKINWLPELFNNQNRLIYCRVPRVPDFTSLRVWVP